MRYIIGEIHHYYLQKFLYSVSSLYNIVNNLLIEIQAPSMSQSGSQNVKLSEEIISDIQRRSDAAGFESTDEYIEYILKVVLTELDSVEET